jgi:methionyl-tRNA formyltransferase
MRIVFFGTPSFAVPSLEKLLSSGKEISAVITQIDKKKGRGQAIAQSAIKKFAESKGLNIIQPEKIKDKSFIDNLSLIKPDFIVVVAYGKILPGEILSIPRHGCINVHASLLPKYRGAAPIQWAIINGEKITGVTTMLMDQGLDTGNILLQKEIGIENSDTSETLSEKLAEAGSLLLIDTINKLQNKDLIPIKQAGGMTYAPIIKKQDGLINWKKSAVELFNFVRGMYPWPSAYCHINKERIKLIEAAVVNGAGKAGRIEKAQKHELLIGTGNGLLSILKLQPEGKKVMEAEAFIQGRKITEGTYVDETQMA